MFFSTLFLALSYSFTVLADPSISSFPNSLTLDAKFDPIKEAYWTGLPHHRRTPFAVSPDGKSAYLAYLDSTFKSVHVQQVDPTTFSAVGSPYVTAGFEAGGLVAHNDGFALLTTVTATSSNSAEIPPNSYPIVSLIRYQNGAEAWRTPLNGPGVHPADGLTATPDINGDLVFSSASGLYAAYFVVTAYTGWAAGHFGDSVQYVDSAGKLQSIPQSSTFGCSHNTGIGLEAADAPPFASICAEDQGAIWLNTDTRYMSGVKIANENVTNGASGEPMGGMSGSYSNLALFPGTTKYIFAWQSRGALDLTQNEWLGAPYTQSSPRWLNHNVAISTMSSKNTLTGAQASSTVGDAVGDSQVNWITSDSTVDHQNVHVAAISSTLSLVTYEVLTNPKCQAVPLGCTGTYAGTSFQLVDNTGKKVGNVVTSTSVFVSGDIANVGTDKVCWPYVDTTWDLSAPKSSGPLQAKMSFACASVSGTPDAPVVSVSSSSPATSAAATSVAASSSTLVVSTTKSPVVAIPAPSSSAVAPSVSASASVSSTIAATVKSSSTAAPSKSISTSPSAATAIPASTSSGASPSASVITTIVTACEPDKTAKYWRTRPTRAAGHHHRRSNHRGRAL